jgi:hypothetical protein
MYNAFQVLGLVGPVRSCARNVGNVTIKKSVFYKKVNFFNQLLSKKDELKMVLNLQLFYDAYVSENIVICIFNFLEFQYNKNSVIYSF